jgi:pyrroline-5-carboxylate reductase
MSTPIGRVCVVGYGNMGSAMLDRWLAAGVVAQEAVGVCDILPERARSRGIEAVDDVRQLGSGWDVLVLAVKPQLLAQVAPTLRGLDPALTISVLAGTSVATLREAGVPGQALVRAMPNTAARIGQSATVLFAEPTVASSSREVAERLFDAVGTSVWVDREPLMHASTALVGSGPAFVFILAEALADAGVSGGLPRATAQRLAAAMIAGAGGLLAASPADAAALKDAVASPAGTTIAGIDALERHAFRGAVMAAVDAAIARSKALEAGE